VGEFGGHGCVAAITVALMTALGHRGVEHPARAIPWYFPTVEDYRSRLLRGRFDVEYIALIPHAASDRDEGMAADLCDPVHRAAS